MLSNTLTSVTEDDLSPDNEDHNDNDNDNSLNKNLEQAQIEECVEVCENKENEVRGIKLHNTSYDAVFPEINVSSNSLKVLKELDNNIPVEGLQNDEGKADLLNVSIKSLVDDSLWNNFTSTLKSSTPKVSKKNSSHKNLGEDASSVNNGKSFMKKHFKKLFPSSSEDNIAESNEKVKLFHELSDTPFITASNTNVATSEKSNTLSTAASASSLASISPTSLGFGTPQRLYDLCIVQKRLASLKREHIKKSPC